MERPSAHEFRALYNALEWCPDPDGTFSYANFSSPSDAAAALVTIHMAELQRVSGICDESICVKWLDSRLEFARFFKHFARLEDRLKGVSPVRGQEDINAELLKHYERLARRHFFEVKDERRRRTAPRWRTRHVLHTDYIFYRATVYAIFRIDQAATPPSAAEVSRHATEALRLADALDESLAFLSLMDPWIARRRSVLPPRLRAEISSIAGVARRHKWNNGAGSMIRYFVQEFYRAAFHDGWQYELPAPALLELVQLIDDKSYLSPDTITRYVERAQRIVHHRFPWADQPSPHISPE